MFNTALISHKISFFYSDIVLRKTLIYFDNYLRYQTIVCISFAQITIKMKITELARNDFPSKESSMRSWRHDNMTSMPTPCCIWYFINHLQMISNITNELTSWCHKKCCIWILPLSHTKLEYEKVRLYWNFVLQSH